MGGIVNIRTKLLIICALLCGLCGCKSEAQMKQISSVEYSYLSGSILPELQLNEVFRIASDKVTFTRNGVVEKTQVNNGEWEIPFDQADMDQLYADLAKVDCGKIEQISPEDAPDGGHTLGYAILYSDGTTCSLYYFPGTTYTNGEWITEPLTAFIQKLTLPEEATSQYKQ